VIRRPERHFRSFRAGIALTLPQRLAVTAGRNLATHGPQESSRLSQAMLSGPGLSA
jgi:hypothetical protein